MRVSESTTVLASTAQSWEASTDLIARTRHMGNLFRGPPRLHLALDEQTRADCCSVIATTKKVPSI